MEFGLLSQKETSTDAAIPAASTKPINDKPNGSGNLKEKRSELGADSWRVSKMPRPFEVEIPSNKTENFIAFGRSNIWPSGGDEGQKMLSFSSSEPHFQNDNYTRIRGGFNEGTRGPFTRLKGPFTPSQWMELERQALIYKHMVANVPIPSHLLVPFKNPLNPCSSSGSCSSNFLGWSPFHLGFSSSNDPEPGRCRRTDGKKWRCSRDAVPDQKYCERHINRGRHRSRKPVEGQTGQAVSGSTTSSMAAIASSSSTLLISGSSTPKSLAALQHKPNSVRPNTVNLVNRTQEFQDLCLIPPTISLNSKDTSFSTHKQRVPCEGSSNSDFGLVYSDSLVNPSQRIPYLNAKNSGPFMSYNDQEANDQHPVRHFIDDCPKDQSDRAPVSWPEEMKSDWTQLSMSIPVAPPDFSSSSYLSLQEKPTTLLSCEPVPTQMSLSVGNDVGESLQKQLNWLPVCWGNAMGGPLGEVLTSTAANIGAGRRSSSLKAYNKSPQFDSSPNGVLQKSTFVSLSNSSSGSSHSAENKRAP